MKRIDLQEKLQFFDWEVKSKTGGIKKARLQWARFLDYVSRGTGVARAVVLQGNYV